MFTKPEQLTPVAVARPMRVAYLIDLDDAPDVLFDEINLEAYGRWGGRRTLIAPAKPAGIDPRYLGWATYFDADIIYSFVKLDDAVVANLHELLGPAFLRFHEDRRSSGEAERSFSIRLPMLSSRP